MPSLDSKLDIMRYAVPMTSCYEGNYELGRKGIKLPDDLPVIGYDNAFLPKIRMRRLSPYVTGTKKLERLPLNC